MTAFEAYQLYLALKQHFTVKSYDFFKYNGKVRASQSTFEKRRDRYFFEKLSRRNDAKDLIISNLIKDVNYINDMLSSEGQQRLSDYDKITSGLSYHYKEQLGLIGDLNKTLKFDNHTQYPPLLSGYLSKQISIQTIVILDNICHFLDHWDSRLKDDLLWPEVKIMFDKYRPFLVYDKQKFRQITVDFYINKPVQ